MIPTPTTDRPPAMEGHPCSKPPIIKLPDRNPDSPDLQPVQPATPLRNGHIHLGTCSPVNENGSFVFDQVLKSGKVNRRLKHKHVSISAFIPRSQLTFLQAFRASWKPGYLVLRPNLLSIYKDEEQTRLRLSVTLSDVTAVAPVRSPRSNRQHVFGIFSPSKNYRFQAASEKEVEDWIERIRSETRIDEEDEAFLAFTRSTVKDKLLMDDTSEHSDVDQIRRRAPRAIGPDPSASSPSKRYFYTPGYSTNDLTSFSEWSDGPVSPAQMGSISPVHDISPFMPIERPAHCRVEKRTDSDLSRDPERVICHGYLQGLRIEGGVRQWRRLWVVLRPKSLAFYKDDQEYSAIKIVPMPQVIDAAEIDPLSRTKNFCFQIIAEEKSYRLCAPDEESFARWLGCLKSIIVVTRQNAKGARPLTPI